MTGFSRPSVSPPHTAPGAGSLAGMAPSRPRRLGGLQPRSRGVSWTSQSTGSGKGCPLTPLHPGEHLARGYLRGRGSPQPIGRTPATFAVGFRVMSDLRCSHCALRWARAILVGTFIRRREEPAAALEAGDELGILQAPQQLGHGAPGPPPPPRQCL